MPGDAVIELLNASVCAPLQPGTPLVEGVNWTIRQGDFWVLSGPPGCGKSSLLTTAGGLARPAEGICRLFGRDTAELHGDALARERLRVGIVFANGGRLFQNLLVAENVALPLAYHRDASVPEIAERVADILSRLGLGALADLPPARVPTRLRGRVALARALALDPDVLLLDDPLHGLNRGEIRWWLDFLSGLNAGDPAHKERRITLVVATSDLAAWAERAGSFALIHSRRWTLLGGREALKARTGPIVRELFPDGLE